MYETGLWIAFLMWVFNATWLIVMLNSQLERNLNKMGQRLSWLSLTPTPLTPKDLSRGFLRSAARYFLIVGFGLPFVLLSWLYVLMAIGMFIFAKSKDAGAPQGIREFRWKLRNLDLTFDQLVREMMRAEGVEESRFQESKDALVADLRERGVYAPLGR